MRLQWPLSFKNTISRVDLNSLAAWFGYTSSGGMTVTEKNAVDVTAVMCAVRVLGEGVGQMPLRIRKTEIKHGREYSPNIKEHWAWKLLVQRPNNWMSPYEFQEYAISIAALFGDFVAVKNMSSNGEVKELLPLVPGSWKVEQDERYNLKYTVRLKNGVDQIFSRNQVMHLRGPSINGFVALKPVELARDAVALAANLGKSQALLASNGGRPSGILSSENPITPEQAKQIKDSWTDKFGANGEGGVAVIDGGWKFSAMQMSAVDSQHIESRKFQIEEIARAFRVLPQMLMHSDKTSTFASAESFFRAHVTHSLGPWVLRYENVIDRDILAGEKDVYADLDERQLLRGDFKDQSDYYAKALGAGGTPAWMTQNDVRSEVGLEPVDDENADKLFGGFTDTATVAPDDNNDNNDDNNSNREDDPNADQR